MFSRKQKLLLMKIISLFSVVRGYNIPVIILAQYLSAIFILSPEKGTLANLLDLNLFFIYIKTSTLTNNDEFDLNIYYPATKIQRGTSCVEDVVHIWQIC